MNGKNLLIAVFLMLVCTVVNGQDALYKVKTGKIIYQYEVEKVSTDYILIFADFGKKYATETTIIMEGIPEKSRTIFTPEALYTLNYGDKQAMKFPAEMMNQMEDPEDEEFDVNELAISITAKGGVKVGNEMVAGKNCDVYEYTSEETGKGKFWIWNGIMLKGDFMEEGHHAFIEAKEINTDITIAASEFEVPADFTITDMGKAMKEMQEMQQKYGTPEEDE
jgi:hypothetical protein